MDIQRSINLISNTMSLDVPLLAIMIVLVLLSAFFSMSETVFSTVNIVRLRLGVEESVKGSKKALYCAENFDKTLTTLLIGNNIVNIALATISVGFFAKLLANNPTIVEIVSTAVITIVVLIFGEILPKTLGKRNSDTIALYLGGIIYYIGVVLYPIVIIFRGIQNLTNNVKEETNEPKVNEAELEVILDTMEEEGAIESEEVELIQNILELNDRSVKDIMVPRVDMVTINVEDSIEEITNTLFECKYSRIPVYEDDKDNIIGILYEREFLTHVIKNNKVTVKNMIKPVKYVSKSMKVNSLIHDLQKSKMHIAVVIGEYGETAGLVTMEDALEELVGEIYDEHDSLEDDVYIKRIDDNEYLLNAAIYLEDLFDELELGKTPETEAAKLSGWLYSECETLPAEGMIKEYSSKFIARDEDDEYVEYNYQLLFEITKVEDRRIVDVKLTIDDLTKKHEDED